MLSKKKNLPLDEDLEELPELDEEVEEEDEELEEETEEIEEEEKRVEEKPQEKPKSQKTTPQVPTVSIQDVLNDFGRQLVFFNQRLQKIESDLYRNR